MRNEGRTISGVAAALAVSVAVLAGGCDDSSTSPSALATATIAVANERFRVALTTPAQVEGARAAQAGGRARIPNGRIAAGTQVNAGWSWHLEDVEFVETTIELCDGRPSDVEREGAAFGGGRFCPWTATVVGVEDR
jgi:hypothetical protein